MKSVSEALLEALEVAEAQERQAHIDKVRGWIAAAQERGDSATVRRNEQYLRLLTTGKYPGE